MDENKIHEGAAATGTDTDNTGRTNNRSSWTCNSSNRQLNTALDASFIRSGHTSKNKFLEEFLLAAINGTAPIEPPQPEKVYTDAFVERMAAVPGLMHVYEVRKLNNLDADFVNFLCKAIDFAVNSTRKYRRYEFAVPEKANVDFGQDSFIDKKLT